MKDLILDFGQVKLRVNQENAIEVSRDGGRTWGVVVPGPGPGPDPGQGDTFTTRVKALAGIQDGQSNTDMTWLYSLAVPVDTRRWHYLDWTETGKPLRVEIRDSDGVKVIAIITWVYNEAERPTQQILTIPREGQEPIVVIWHQTFDQDTGTKLLERWAEVSGLD